MVKGILLETKGPFGVVMTADGRFARILLTTMNRTLGQEVTGREIRLPSLKQGLAVASVLLVLMVGLWAKIMINPAAAYVALDINPSLELAVNDAGMVIEAQGLDQEGIDLLEKVNPEKLEIYQAVALLVEGAAQSQYLNDINNVVLTTVTPVKDNVAAVDEAKLQTVVKQLAAKLPAPVKVVTQQATIKEHQEAVNKGLSVGRYLIHQSSSDKGKKVTLEEVKSKGLGQLEKEKGIKLEQLLPHARFASKEAMAPSKEAMAPSIKEKQRKAVPSKQKEVKNPKAAEDKDKYQDKLSPGQLKKRQETKKVEEKPEVNNKVKTPSSEDKEDRDSDDEEDYKQRRDDRRQGYWEDKGDAKHPGKKPNHGWEKTKKENDKGKD